MQWKAHHVALIVSDYAASKRFYTELLGFAVVRENYRADRDSWKLDLQLGEMELELFCLPNPPPRVTNPEAAGLRHLCFAVETVACMVQTLAKKGIVCEPVRVDPYTDKLFTFFFDPDGLPLELHE